MTFDEYWAQLTKKNPLLKTEQRLSVQPAKLKAMLSQCYGEGFEQGKTVAGKFGSIVDELFGAKK